MKRITLILGLLSGVTFGAVFAGAVVLRGNAIDPGSGLPRSELMNFEGYEAEYQAAASELLMPPGASLPPGREPPREPTTYQRGSGLTEAQGLWLCAWEQEWLAQRGNDKARAAAALEQLRAAPALEYMTKYLDQVGKDLFTNALAQADKGNADGFELDAELNCND